MSTQRGNDARSRPQKHRNRSAFKNDLHDTSRRTKMINGISVGDVCVRCKEIIEWKIKYKKYKPLSQPKKCVRCGEKTVKRAYHVACGGCAAAAKICAKCCEAKEVVALEPEETERLKLDNEMRQLLQSLPERKRRTFLRYMSKKDAEAATPEAKKSDLMEKLETLKLDDKSDDDDDFPDFSDAESDVNTESDDNTKSDH